MMTTTEWIQVATVAIMILALLVTYVAMKRDNRKSNRETIENMVQNKVHDVQELMELKGRVDLIEQKMGLNNLEIKKDVGEIKAMISELFQRFNRHIEAHNIKDYK
jgi:Na+(H+)/acetate symporter ActP